ncbi:MAG: hypothetical protein DCF22_02960 [Leptolyngbya sp.]|nr:MAG: hypothetical protein DCF22_02960 [Leptolyngbya sp.]
MQTPDRLPTKAPVSSLPVPALELFISLATAPLLIGLVGGKALAEVSQEIGKLAEEVFRGDRLPLLNLSNPTLPLIDTVNPD